jgi:periplasmic protein TonB
MELKKSPEANIEKKRASFLLIGAVVTLGVVLSSFEYRQFTKKAIMAEAGVEEILEEEVVLDMPPPVPPPPPPPPAIVTEIEVVEDDKKIENTVTISTEETDKKVEVFEIKEVEEAPVAETIFDVVEENASFPGGEALMGEFLRKNIKYPPMARESGIQGRVYVEFIVYKDGTIGDVKIRRGVSPELDEEALRVVKMMPKWEPGKQRGKPVTCRFTLPINFKLQ